MWEMKRESLKGMNGKKEEGNCQRRRKEQAEYKFAKSFSGKLLTGTG